MSGREGQTEITTADDLPDEIESENLYLALVAVDRRTLQVVLLKMQGYSTKDVRRILRTFIIKKNVDVTDNGKIII